VTRGSICTSQTLEVGHDHEFLWRTLLLIGVTIGEAAALT
jgi:hypothetical protein